MTLPSAEMKYSSLPPARHRGAVPPADETMTVSGSYASPSEGAANRRTTTSLRPDSSETYATHRLSGEN